MNFFEMGVSVNDELFFIDDTSISVTVLSPKKVLYDGDEMSLTMATRKAKGLDDKHPIRPSPHWLYMGEILTTIYDKTYEF